MKIVFLCGSVEPGRDGVGDYTRKLAAELINSGHEAGIIALNEQHIKTELDNLQESGGKIIPVLRLPSAWSSKRRFTQASIWIDKFQPEWLSLQFVPFAFHPKGLPFNMGNLLASLTKDRRWHIMVHELWVGMDKQTSMKLLYWGWLQRLMIKSLFNKLKPSVIHTQSGLYVKMLKKIGLKAFHLPLFGNIPVKEKAPVEKTQEINSSTNGKSISFVVFGGIHAGAPISELAKDLRNYSNDKDAKVILRMIGRCGGEQNRWEQEWKAAGLTLELFGEQPEERISEVLSTSSFGISTTPASLVEKSGSMAAMREHGLNILCVARDWSPRGVSDLQLPPGVTNYELGRIQQFIETKRSPDHVKNVSEISHQFANDLLSA
jgi:hypothetical protein